VHPKTVSRAIARGSAPRRTGRPRGSRLDAFKPQVDALLAEGVPIEAVCVAAGVPSAESGAAAVRTRARAGVRFVAFKPGSVDAIRRVLDIAAAVAPYPVVLQWTGGRAGGHHSFEDAHAPLAATYAAIRRTRNVVLVAGSGVGSAACAAGC
jgi:enoyl reductase-like protein